MFLRTATPVSKPDYHFALSNTNNLLQFLHFAHSCSEYSLCRQYLMLHTNLGKKYPISISLLTKKAKRKDFQRTYNTSISFIRQTACQEAPGS